MGVILCADKGYGLARHAREGLPSKVMAANYRRVLPDTDTDSLQNELENTRFVPESRGANSIKACQRWTTGREGCAHPSTK